MKYQLLVLDIDGTTANSKKEVDEEDLKITFKKSGS